MQDVTLVGIDLGKHSFHVHGQDRTGKAVFRKKLSRKQLLEFFRNTYRSLLDGVIFAFTARLYRRCATRKQDDAA